MNKKSFVFFCALCCQETHKHNCSDHWKTLIFLVKKYCHNFFSKHKVMMSQKQAAFFTLIQLWFEAVLSFCLVWWFGLHRFGDVLHPNALSLVWTLSPNRENREWCPVSISICLTWHVCSSSLLGLLWDILYIDLSYCFHLCCYFLLFCQRIAKRSVSAVPFLHCSLFVGLSHWLASFRQNKTNLGTTHTFF